MQEISRVVKEYALLQNFSPIDFVWGKFFPLTLYRKILVDFTMKKKYFVLGSISIIILIVLIECFRINSYCW